MEKDGLPQYRQSPYEWFEWLLSSFLPAVAVMSVLALILVVQSFLAGFVPQ